MAAWKKLIRRRVVVNLHSGNAITGVLWEERGGLLVLKEAKYLEGNAEPVRIEGEAVVQLINVEFTQVLAEGA